MEPLPGSSEVVDERFARRFRACAGGDGPVSFATFMDLALFDPEVGYYAAERARVGKGRGTDFYTSSTFAGVFAPLVVAAAEALLRVGGRSPDQHVFVEIGAEPGRALLTGIAHRFAGTVDVRLGQRPAIPAAAVVFSNELFDAQPFHRLIWRDGRWSELGVALVDGRLVWQELPALSDELAPVMARLPASSDDGYQLDVPWRAVRLLESIAAPGWSGVFMAFDYGRTWQQISEDFPQGTGRAFRAHRQSGELLDAPGQQDLTCHVCWDWLEETLGRCGFTTVRRESQEAFFVKHATAAIEAIVRRDPNPLSPARSQLKQVLHPALMGHRFEALWAVRP